MKRRPSVRQMLAADPGVKPNFRSGGSFTDRLYNDTVVDVNSTDQGFHYLLGALRSRAPGQWSANILEFCED